MSADPHICPAHNGTVFPLGGTLPCSQPAPEGGAEGGAGLTDGALPQRTFSVPGTVRGWGCSSGRWAELPSCGADISIGGEGNR